jgi:hypothetical protein
MAKAKSNGWQSGETTNNPRQLVRGAVSVRSNVHQNGTALEIVIHDLDAPRDERWTSITVDRRTGLVGVGRHRDAKEAWKISINDQANQAVENRAA